MEIKPQDYIHFYIGQDVITPDGRGKLVGLPWSIVGQDRVSVHFGKMVATKNSIDGGYNKTRNHGDYLIKPQHLTPIVSSEDMDDIHLPGGVQLILRKLSNMTEEERLKYGWTIEDTDEGLKVNWPFESFRLLCKDGWDLFGLIPAGLAIDKTSLKN